MFLRYDLQYSDRFVATIQSAISLHLKLYRQLTVSVLSSSIASQLQLVGRSDFSALWCLHVGYSAKTACQPNVFCFLLSSHDVVRTETVRDFHRPNTDEAGNWVACGLLPFHLPIADPLLCHSVIAYVPCPRRRQSTVYKW
jgi:hypothetical protein